MELFNLSVKFVETASFVPISKVAMKNFSLELLPSPDPISSLKSHKNLADPPNPPHSRGRLPAISPSSCVASRLDILTAPAVLGTRPKILRRKRMIGSSCSTIVQCARAGGFRQLLSPIVLANCSPLLSSPVVLRLFAGCLLVAYRFGC